MAHLTAGYLPPARPSCCSGKDTALCNLQLPVINHPVSRWLAFLFSPKAEDAGFQSTRRPGFYVLLVYWLLTSKNTGSDSSGGRNSVGGGLGAWQELKSRARTWRSSEGCVCVGRGSWSRVDAIQRMQSSRRVGRWTWGQGAGHGEVRKDRIGALTPCQQTRLWYGKDNLADYNHLLRKQTACPIRNLNI